MCLRLCHCELDDPSGHHDFPWMALHCNFQGLVAESDSDRDPGNCCFLRGQRGVCTTLLPSSCYLKAQVKLTLASAAHALNNGQNILWVQFVDVLMIDAGCTDVMWPHAWNSVCGSSYRRFLLVCERLVNNIQSGISGPAEAPEHSDSESGSTSAVLATAITVTDLQAVHVYDQ